MENQSPAIPKWSALLIEAVTKPGLASDLSWADRSFVR
jgi:hypothetical protein